MFKIRPIHPDDASTLHAIMINPEVYSTLARIPSMELAEVEAWTRKEINGRYRLVVEADGKPIAQGSLTHNLRGRMHHSGNLGMYVSHHYWGQGVGTMLLEALLDLADNWLNLNRLQLESFTNNEAANHLYKKVGFEVEGISKMVVFGNGGWQDEYVMARLRNIPKQLESPKWSPPPKSTKSINNIVIRPYLSSDIPQIHQLMTFVDVSRTTLQIPAYELNYYEKRRDPSSNNHRFVAVDGEKVVGLVSIQVNANPRMAHSAGLGMSVHPEYWGIGVGSMLMEQILDTAENWLNLKRVELDVNTDNPGGIRLYEKFGFEVEGKRRLHTYGNGRWADSYFMAKLRP
ncbi:MAG: GNAT family N-acetyltransferase [Chloroflexota bacterium]